MEAVGKGSVCYIQYMDVVAVGDCPSITRGNCGCDCRNLDKFEGPVPMRCDKQAEGRREGGGEGGTPPISAEVDLDVTR